MITRSLRARARLLWIGVALLSVAWGKPPPEWARPSLVEELADFARGSAAVRLLDVGDVRYIAEDRVRRTYRGVVRMKSEAGRASVRCAYGYNADTERIVAARAWIVARDGKSATEVALREFTEAAAQAGRFFWPQQRVLGFTPGPRIEIGGALAWEFEIESQAGLFDLNWSFASDLPVLASILEITPPPGGKLEWRATSERVFPPVAGAAPGALRWVQRRVAVVGGERPDGFFPAPFMVQARLMPTAGRSTWAGLAQLAAAVIEPRIVISPEVRARADAAVAGRSARWDRVRALAEFVQREITYLSITLDRDYLAGYRPHPPDEVLRNRFGDCKDKAALLVALLRAAGENADVMLVYAGNPGGVQPDWPAACFNHAIVAIAADASAPPHWPAVTGAEGGRSVLFDPTDPQTPLGALPLSVNGGYGLIASPQSTGLTPLPVGGAEQNRHDCTIDAVLAGDGTITATVAETTRGAPGVRLHAIREQLRQERFGTTLEARLKETMAFVRDLRWSDTWELDPAAWRLEFGFTAGQYARRTGGSLMLVSPQVIFTKARLAPWKTAQEGVVWFGSGLARKVVRLALPAGTTVEELPDDWSQTSAGASCSLRYRREEHVVICESEFRHEAGFLDQAAYEALRAVVQKMQDAERRPVLLRRGDAVPAPVAK